LKNPYNLGDPGFLSNPAPVLSQMRAEASLVKVKIPIIGSIWVTTTYAATSQVAKAKDTFLLTGMGAGLKKKVMQGYPGGLPQVFVQWLRICLAKMIPNTGGCESSSTKLLCVGAFATCVEILQRLRKLVSHC
jgi:hypothetical protein